MRALTNAEQALLAARQDAVRRWILRYVATPSFAPLALFRPDDLAVSLTMGRVNLLAKVALYEPTGDAAVHQLLADAVWGYVQAEMRVPPETFYRRHDYTSWYAALNDTNRRYAANWHRVVIPTTAEGTIAAAQVPVAQVQAGYHAVAQKDVLKWLGFGALRILPASEVPNPAQPLAVEDVAVTIAPGGQATASVAAVGGRSPYTYSVVDEDVGAPAKIRAVFIAGANSSTLAVVAVLATPEGEYTTRIRVTDAAGDTAEAALTVTIEAADDED